MMNGIVGFEDVVVKNKYIYALFNGEKMSERDEKAQGGKTIYVFDYEGKPVKKITLDRRISCLYIDDEERVMYALDLNSDEPLYRARLREY
jgi:hypothetical protein